MSTLTPRHDLTERTELFAAAVRKLIKRLPRTQQYHADVKQLIRSSGSVAANYIEAQEAVSKKDFVYRLRICRKEAKESGLWLRLLDIPNNLNADRIGLEKESQEFVYMFTAMILKAEKKM